MAYMTKRRFKRQSPHKDMKIEYAPTRKVEMLAQVAHEFMQEILDLEPGSYVISDESDLRDFTDFGVSDTLPLWKRIKASYALNRADVGSERLVDIFLAIERRRHFQ
jgi:hypothetical protein